jgi:cytochrome P450
MSPRFLSSFFFLGSLFILFTYSIWRLYNRGKQVRALYKNVPGPPHDPVWGHMKALAGYMQGDKHIDYAVLQIWKDIGRPPFFYTDTWPVHQPGTIFIADAELAESLSKSTSETPNSYPKPPIHLDFRPLLGNTSIISVAGEQWKALRKRYNPGFSPQHLRNLVPEIVKETLVFVDKLERSVNKEITLGDFTTSLTVDIICTVIFGHSFNSQTRPSKLTSGFHGALSWQLERERQNPFHLYNPFRPIMMSYYMSRVNSAVDAEILQAANSLSTVSPKSVLALTLSVEKSRPPPRQFLLESRDQIKSFLFAGHDTTSSALMWLYYELSLPHNAPILTRLRDEHISVFGRYSPADPTAYNARVTSLLTNQTEDTLNALTYTLAVFKETLRVHPPAAGSKFAPTGTNLTAPYNRVNYLLDNHTLYMPTMIYHLDERYWGPDASTFNPDRWLPDAKWQINIHAFRPFERGPRNCIGQELVYIEVKIILAFTVQRFGFQKAGNGEVYMVRRITAKPNDGMRMYVLRAM